MKQCALINSSTGYKTCWFMYLLCPSNNVDGGYRNSQRLTGCPAGQKESYLKAIIFHRSISNFYSMFIPLTKFIIYSFINMWQKSCCHSNHFFSFHASIHICLCQFLTWKHEGKWMSYFHNKLHEVQHHLCVTFKKFWPKMLPWQHFHCAPFNNHNMSYNYKTISQIFMYLF